MKRALISLLCLFVLFLAGCATAPTGPHVLVLPGSNKSFDQFRADEQECRSYAQSQIGSGSGGLAGSTGAGRAQQRYDFAYQQCMYAKGHKVPVEGYALPERSPRRASIPPPPPPR